MAGSPAGGPVTVTAGTVSVTAGPVSHGGHDVNHHYNGGVSPSAPGLLISGVNTW